MTKKSKKEIIIVILGVILLIALIKFNLVVSFFKKIRKKFNFLLQKIKIYSTIF